MNELDTDLAALSDAVLVISPASDDSQRLIALLNRRRCRWIHVHDLNTAAEHAAESLFDLVVVDLPELDLRPEQIADRIGSDPYLGKFPLIVIHEDAERASLEMRESLGLPVQFVPRPLDATSALVKISQQLRLRKLQADEGRYLSKVASQNVELRELTARFQRDLREAQEIQRSILPTTLPQAESSSFAAAYLPLEAVGGDLYDIWQIGQGRFGMFIADVTGHGLSAAFIGAMTKMALAYAGSESPDSLLDRMNRALCPVMPDGRFVTAAVAIYTPATGELSLARGGHPPPLLYRAASGTVEQIKSRGFPLGVMSEGQYELHTTRMDPGDKLLLVTDGITETANLDGALLGIDGVVRLFQEASATLPIAQSLAFLLDRQEEFSEGRLIKDDVTLVGVEARKAN